MKVASEDAPRKLSNVPHPYMAQLERGRASILNPSALHPRRVARTFGFGTGFGSVITNAMEEANRTPTLNQLKETVRQAKMQRIRRQATEAPFSLDFKGADSMVQMIQRATPKMVYVSARILSLAEVSSCVHRCCMRVVPACSRHAHAGGARL
jgi:hypothetical protein